MSSLTVRLPNSIHEKVRELAVQDDISVNQFIASAVAEKMSAFLTLDYLRAEAKKGKQSDFDEVLALVPNVPAMAGDELPAGWRAR